MKKDEEKLSQRFVEEFERLGQPKNKIASELGVVPQTLTNITKGYNLPSVMLLAKLKAAYPQFNTEYVINGDKSVEEADSSYVEKVKNLEQELGEVRRAFVNLAMKNVDILGSGKSVAQLGKYKGATLSPSSFSALSAMPIPHVNPYTNKVSTMSWVASIGAVRAIS